MKYQTWFKVKLKVINIPIIVTVNYLLIHRTYYVMNISWSMLSFVWLQFRCCLKHCILFFIIQWIMFCAIVDRASCNVLNVSLLLSHSLSVGHLQSQWSPSWSPLPLSSWRTSGSEHVDMWSCDHGEQRHTGSTSDIVRTQDSTTSMPFW